MTYQDIAKIWQVSARTVRRWVAALEKLRRIRPLRPTTGTVADVRFPAKIPAKTDGKIKKLKKTSGEKASKSVQKRLTK